MDVPGENRLKDYGRIAKKITAITLFRLGLGWNFAYVAGSTLLADQLSPVEQAKTQGGNDLLRWFASAADSSGSGLNFALGWQLRKPQAPPARN